MAAAAAAETRPLSLIRWNSNHTVFISLLAGFFFFQIKWISSGCLFFDPFVYGYIAPMKRPCQCILKKKFLHWLTSALFKGVLRIQLFLTFSVCGQVWRCCFITPNLTGDCFFSFFLCHTFVRGMLKPGFVCLFACLLPAFTFVRRKCFFDPGCEKRCLELWGSFCWPNWSLWRTRPCCIVRMCIQMTHF